jgi:OmcA/MtrC family decaheme c-type cytochrome
MKVMIHKIHMGAQLPSVQAGGEYAIWGFSDTKHDYSNVKYPQDIRNCANCHAGTGSDPGNDTLQLTSEGDNWSQHAGRKACGSCHDDLDFSQHFGGQQDDSNCMSCHGIGGVADTIASSHGIAAAQARGAFAAEVLAIDNTAAGQFPVVNFRIFDPRDNSNYDIFNDSPWIQGDGASRLAITLGWSTSDYTNTGNGEEDASTVSIDALANGVANGDGSYRVTSPIAIPDGSLAPNILASGSGVAVVEGHPALDLDGSGSAEQIPLTNSVGFYSIDEADGVAVPRRQSVVLDNCLNCHQSLVLHGNNRSDNIDSCVSCHNPRNTDREVRDVAAQPPTDGKDEESLDFKTMVHGIHAASMRKQALQIVGFRGFTTYVYDEQAVHYPGQLGNCLACHTEQGFQLPLAPSVLGTTVDTGADHTDPGDDTVVTPIAAACSSCHDGASSKAHMVSSGGASFATSQAAIDSGAVQEQCTLCHGPGRSSDVAEVHPLIP